MTWHLQRITQVEDATIGFLTTQGRFVCWTLEDRLQRGPKVPGQTAIPAGTYPLRVTWSPRFKKPLPLVLSVPNFDGIRIHAGNTAADTDGCILVGLQWRGAKVLDSRKALALVLAQLGDTTHRLVIANPAGPDDGA